MTLDKLSNFFLGTLRGRLILSVALIHAIMMTLFIMDVTIRQRALLLDNQTGAALAMSQSLATSAAGWIAADDLSGLQELAEAQHRYPEMSFVILTDETGRILAHTDKNRIGLYLLDLPQDPQETVFSRSATLVDVAVPALLGNRHVGWVRVGLGQQATAEKISTLTLVGVVYAFAAILIGSLLAWYMGSFATQRLYEVQNTISEVKRGNQTARSNITGGDEAASIAQEFNSMLDTLSIRESELSASENRFRKLFNSAAIPLCFATTNEEKVDFNTRFEETFGYTHDDIPTLNAWWQLAYPDPEYRAWVVSTWDAATEKATSEKIDVQPIEYNVTCKNGRVRTMVISGAPLDNGILATFFDVTDRKQAEVEREQYYRFFSSASDLMVIADPNGAFIKINPSCLQVLGYSEAELMAKPFIEFVHPDDKRSTLNEMTKQQETGSSLHFENRYICKDGSFRWLSWRATYKKEEGVTYAVARDMTDRKQVMDALQEREQHAQSLLRISKNLEHAQTYADALNAAHQEVSRTIGYQSLWVYLLSEDKKYFKSLVAGGLMSDTVMSEEGTATLTIQGDQMLEEIAAAKDIVIIKDAQTDERTNKELVARLGNRTIINVPIILFDRHHGSVGLGTFGDEGVHIPSKSEQEYLKSMASHLAVSLDRIHLSAERKRAEEGLRKNNNLLERIFSSTEFLVAYLDADFNFIRVNRAYAEADAKDPEFFIGKNHFDLYPNAENEKTFQQVAESGEPYIAYAKPFKYPDRAEQETTYWNYTLQPVKETGGRVVGLVLSLVDVTEREKALTAQHESDERYRILVEQAGDGIFVADPQGNYVDVNPAGCAMLGYTREEILKLNMKDLASSESQRKKPLQFNELQVRKSITTERMLVTKDGTLLPVEISGRVLDNGNFLGIVRDITERKHHELERDAIITVSAALRQATTKNEILNIILDQVVSLFEADGAMLVLPNAQSGGFVDEIGRGVVGERMKGLHIPPGKGVCHWVITNKKPYLSNHADRDPLFYRADLLGASICIASAPLIAQEQPIGAFWAARQVGFTEEDLRLLTAIADIAANALHRVMLHEQTEQQLNHLMALHQIDIAISSNFDSNLTLNVILNNVKKELEVDAADILLLDPITHTLDYAAGLGFRTRIIEQSHVKLEDGHAGTAAHSYRTVSCPDLNLTRDSFSRSSLITTEGFVAHFATPLIVKGQVKGVLELFHRKKIEHAPEWIDYFETLATQAAIAIESASLVESLQRSNAELMLAYDATIEGWSRALDLRDKETEGHTLRVTEMALELAEKTGASEIDKQHLWRGSLLHDIGKMGVPDSILLKPGPLSEEEREVMQQHPTYAYQMLSPIPYLKQALEIPYCHHEKWDGSGYPRGLKGEEIPLAARLFAVVDVFDALTSDRPYRKAWLVEEVQRYIEEQSGMHFDPQIVRIFLETRAY